MTTTKSKIWHTTTKLKYILRLQSCPTKYEYQLYPWCVTDTPLGTKVEHLSQLPRPSGTKEYSPDTQDGEKIVVSDPSEGK